MYLFVPAMIKYSDEMAKLGGSSYFAQQIKGDKQIKFKLYATVMLPAVKWTADVCSRGQCGSIKKRSKICAETVTWEVEVTYSHLFSAFGRSQIDQVENKHVGSGLFDSIEKQVYDVESTLRASFRGKRGNRIFENRIYAVDDRMWSLTTSGAPVHVRNGFFSSFKPDIVTKDYQPPEAESEI